MQGMRELIIEDNKIIQRGIVEASYGDYEARLSYLGAVQLAQNASSELLESMGIGGESTIERYGAQWVYMRNYTRLLRRPKWKDEILVESFLAGHNEARIYIDTAVRTPEGELLTYTRLEMVALDHETGSLRQTSTVGVARDAKVYPEQLPITLSRFRRSDLPEIGTVLVQSTNIDYLHHVNNVEYIRFLLNTYTVAELMERPITAIEVNYKNMAYEGDVISIRRERLEGADHYKLQKDDQVLVESLITR